MRIRKGVNGFLDWKFWTVLCLYALANLFFYQSGLSRGGLYTVFPFCMAYLAMGCIAWENNSIGSPYRAHCLLLHFAFGFTLFMFFNRIILSSTQSLNLFIQPVLTYSGIGLLDSLLTGGSLLEYVNQITGYLFSSVVSVIIFFCLAVILSLRRSWALPAFSAFLLFLSLLTMRQNLGQAVSVLLGIVCGVAAVVLQIDDDPQRRYWNRVRERLDFGKEQQRIRIVLKLDLLERLFVKPRLYDPEVRGIVARRLDCSPSDPRLDPVCRQLLEDLVLKDDLADIGEGPRGRCLIGAESGGELDFFARMSLLPKSVVLIGLTVVYILSPIDLIPDSIPVFGLLDDMIIGVVNGTLGFLALTDYRRRSGQPRDRKANGIPSSSRDLLS